MILRVGCEGMGPGRHGFRAEAVTGIRNRRYRYRSCTVHVSVAGGIPVVILGCETGDDRLVSLDATGVDERHRSRVSKGQSRDRRRARFVVGHGEAHFRSGGEHCVAHAPGRRCRRRYLDDRTASDRAVVLRVFDVLLLVARDREIHRDIRLAVVVPDGDRLRRGALLGVPVTLARDDARGRYHVDATDRTLHVGRILHVGVARSRLRSETAEEGLPPLRALEGGRRFDRGARSRVNVALTAGDYSTERVGPHSIDGQGIGRYRVEHLWPDGGLRVFPTCRGDVDLAAQQCRGVGLSGNKHRAAVFHPIVGVGHRRRGKAFLYCGWACRRFWSCWCDRQRCSGARRR